SLGEYFLGGRRIPWWAVWLSILAAEISAATFVGVPAFAYSNDWTYVQPVFGTIVGRFVVAFLFVRPFYEARVTTVYGYLEKRFGTRTRGGAAAVFLATRLLASGVRLYIGAVLLSQVSGERLPVELAIAALAGVTAVYTLVGGIKAVVATDVVQVVVLFGGALTAIAVILYELDALPGGIAAALSSVPAPKTRIFDFSLTFTKGDTPTFAGGLVGGAFLAMAAQGTDQDFVQRLLTAKNVRGSRAALIASGFLDLPVVLLFLSIGTLLLVYFQRLPDAGVPGDADRIFPFFIAHHLPSGAAGLVVAGVLSVAMGSLSASMNALASTATFDYWKPWRGKTASPATEIRAARAFTLAFAVLLALVALATHALKVSGGSGLLLVVAFKAIGYTYGALLGVFLRGFLTRGGGDTANLVAMASSIVFLGVLGATTTLEWTWFVPIGTAVTFFVGALGSRERRSFTIAPGAKLAHLPGSRRFSGAVVSSRATGSRS
ncbi:sodium/solute symporter, partial [bacterium]|nr:sodium/solute symporter [bacterium]